MEPGSASGGAAAAAAAAAPEPVAGAASKVSSKDSKAKTAAAADLEVAQRLAAALVANPGEAMEKASKRSLDVFLRVAVDQYHNSDAPSIVPDQIYDAVLLAYKKRFPKSDVPLVAAPHLHDTSRVTLPMWMGSLTKIVDDRPRWPGGARPTPSATCSATSSTASAASWRSARAGCA